ncbi:MAG TPA: serine/threonine-protein kinase, partial [Polyangia bacterium]
MARRRLRAGRRRSMEPQPPPASLPVRLGEVIAGKYRIDEILGAGGMGVVVGARHLQLAAQVAIKFLLPEAVGQPDAVARFLREARAAAHITSAHVIRITDVDALPSGAPYVVMELLSGRDLGAELAARGRLPVAEAAGWVLEALDAIAEAHRLGIVHRDLKPQNLFLAAQADGTRQLKVLDFGISKVTRTDWVGADLTVSRALLGSPAYMAPEQLRNARDVDHRADLWALGVILHQLVTGTLPFSGETLPTVCAAVLTAETPSVARECPAAPPAFARLVAACLDKDPARRPQHAGELARALAAFAPAAAAPLVARIARISLQRGSSPTRLSGGEIPPTRRGDERVPPLATSGARRRPRGALLLLAVSGAVFVAGAAAAAWWLGRAPARPP